MSRDFNGNAHDYIQLAAGNASGSNGSGTYAVLWRAFDQRNHWLIQGLSGANAQVWGLNPYGGDNRCYWSAGGSFSAMDSWAISTWYLTVVTKAAGSSGVRSHTYNYASTAWTHTTYATIGDSTNGPVAAIRFGGPVGFADSLNGWFAACAVWAGTVLTDLQIQGLTASMASWMALSPSAAWQCNQASVATPVPDLTAGGADQSAISGTVADSGTEPPGWSYYTGGGGNTVNGVLTAPLGGLTATITGKRTIHGTMTAALGGLTARIVVPGSGTATTWSRASAAVMRGRQLAESLMADTCTITRQVGVVTDDLTGAVTPTTSTVYTGQCRVQQSSQGMGSGTEAGQERVELLRSVVSIPVGAVGADQVRYGDVVTVGAAGLDPALVGRRLRVIDVQVKSMATARRLGCVEVT